MIGGWDVHDGDARGWMLALDPGEDVRGGADQAPVLGGDPEMLDVLCLGAEKKSTRRSSRKNDDAAGDDLDLDLDEKEDEVGDVARGRKGKGKKGGKSAAASSEGADAGPYPGYVPPRLGAVLLFQHSVDVLAADAAARIAVFERRVAMQNEVDAAAKSSNEQRPNEPTPSRLGRPSVPSSAGAFSPDRPVPDSQDSDVVPESPDAGVGTQSQKQAPPVDLNARGNWALGVLQNSLLYRLVGLAPSPAEGAALIQDIFELAGFHKLFEIE